MRTPLPELAGVSINAMDGDTSAKICADVRGAGVVVEDGVADGDGVAVGAGVSVAEAAGVLVGITASVAAAVVGVCVGAAVGAASPQARLMITVKVARTVAIVLLNAVSPPTHRNLNAPNCRQTGSSGKRNYTIR